MTLDRFTIKAQEAVQKAVQKAVADGGQVVGALHLLYGTMSVGENVTQYVFGKCGMNERTLQSVLEAELSKQPRVSGGEPYLDREANEV